MQPSAREGAANKRSGTRENVVYYKCRMKESYRFCHAASDFIRSISIFQSNHGTAAFALATREFTLYAVPIVFS